MFPQRSKTEATARPQMYPTSPWTEAFRARPADMDDRASRPAMPESQDDSEAQSPTHDALSEIYNLGY